MFIGVGYKSGFTVSLVAAGCGLGFRFRAQRNVLLGLCIRFRMVQGLGFRCKPPTGKQAGGSQQSEGSMLGPSMIMWG